jgi:membrane protease subunit HflC
MKSSSILYVWTVVIAVILLSSSAYTVQETTQVFITQFGKPVGEPITEPGLHFKIPFIQIVRPFDKRFLEWDGDSNQIPTKDKLYISIDTYARWRIKNPLTFFEKVTDELGAQTRLDDILDGATRNAVSGKNLVDVVRSTSRPDMEKAQINQGNEEIDSLPTFEYGRSAIAQEILKNAAPELEKFGIELLDLRFKRLNSEKSVQKEIFNRMISERKQIAAKFQSEGMGEAAKIDGNRERELKKITSEAFKTAEKIRGDADAEAIAIYAEAYNKSEDSQGFYQFIKTLETYETSLSDKDWLILSTDTEVYQFLKSATPASE